MKTSFYSTQASGGGMVDAFNSKVFLRMDEASVQSLAGPFVRWTSKPNRALVIDAIEFDKEITIIPYSPIED